MRGCILDLSLVPGASFLRVLNLAFHFTLLKTLFREEHTAAGGPSFDRYSNNPIFELEVPSVAQIKYVVIDSYFFLF